MVERQDDMRQTTTPNASWQERAAQIVATAPNPDWKKSGWTLLMEPPVETPLFFFDANNGYKEKQFGTAEVVFCKWDKADGTFIGFAVAVYDGRILESCPVIDRTGTFDAESRQHAYHSVARHIEHRRCPKCGKFDTKKFGRRVVSCKCGYRDSMI